MFAPAKAIADAVLYEGYVLYPYRASSDKNRLRWQWGVVGPPGAGSVGEKPSMATDLVIEPWGETTVQIRLRFLQVVSRQVERLDSGDRTRVESVVIDGQTHVTFEDTVERTVDTLVGLGPATAAASVSSAVPFAFDDAELVEPLGEVDGVAHQMTRRLERISGTLTVTSDAETARPTGRPVRSRRLRVTVANTTDSPEAGSRDGAKMRSMVGTHVLASVDKGMFVSTLDPPDEHADLVRECCADRLWPVLIGAQQRASLVLASPVILYDQPQIAPESKGTFFDGLEIDEMLVLRVMTMTDREKAEARATDARSAAIVDRVDTMPDADMSALHGTIRSPAGRPSVMPTVFDAGATIAGGRSRAETAEELTGKPWWDPGVDQRFDPGSDGVVVAGQAISRGSAVRLHPVKRADAHDIFLRDELATVRAIIHDVDGSIHVAVTVDADPGADINDETGRYLYFSPDEVEPLGRRADQ